MRRGGADSPVAVYTRLGWVLSGPVNTKMNRASTMNLTTTHVLRIETRVQERPNNLSDQLKDFWELESIGIKPEEESVFDKFLKETKFNGERYEVKLPWKEDHRLLPDNYMLSCYRLKSLLKRLKVNANVLKEYDNVIREQLNLGIIEDVTYSNPKPLGKVHYLPHRAVVRQDKSTTKLRIVYDASARANGPSLNDCLHSGPSLLPLLFDILLRFQVNKVALVADIEKAFLNINSRPLTYVYDDDPQNGCLTPSHLFMGRRVLSQRSSEEVNSILEASVTSVDLVKRANHLKHVLQHFWSRWSKEYLTELREHHRAKKRRMNSPQIQGDVVCIHDEKLPRNLWRLGKIQKLIRGKDGHARASVVKVFGEGKQATTIQRPVQRLYPVEISDDSERHEENKDRPRPRRQAAIEADLKRRLTDQQ